MIEVDGGWVAAEFSSFRRYCHVLSVQADLCCTKVVMYSKAEHLLRASAIRSHACGPTPPQKVATLLPLCYDLGVAARQLRGLAGAAGVPTAAVSGLRIEVRTLSGTVVHVPLLLL